MSKIIIYVLAIISSLLFTSVVKAEWVNGYYKSNGTYVAGYYRSDRNGLLYDNYSWTPSQPLYNDSYFDSNYSADWYTPAWNTQDDYWVGLDSYKQNNNYDGWFDNDNYNYDAYDYNYDAYDYNYDAYDYNYDAYDYNWDY